MTEKAFEVIAALSGKTLSTAESCTGGMIGAALTAVPGSSAVYMGGIISYTNRVKQEQLGVDSVMLAEHGAVSGPVAEAMAIGVRERLHTDTAVSVTGLAGPGGDGYGNPVGTVYIGYSDHNGSLFRHYLFSGDREEVRRKASIQALALILENNSV